MRVIEQEMNKAISDRKNWSKDNTRVNVQNGKVQVFLFENNIATLDSGVLILSSCGFKTVTTKSRLNAILQELTSGYYIYQKKGKWYISDGTENVFTENMWVEV